MWWDYWNVQGFHGISGSTHLLQCNKYIIDWTWNVLIGLQCGACDVSAVKTNLTVMVNGLQCTSLSEVTTAYCEGICGSKLNVNPFTGEWGGQ